MSLFGNDTNMETPDMEVPEGRQIEIACACWFTRSGRTIPLSIRFENQEEEIQTLKIAHVIRADERHYNGIVSMEYRCVAEYEQVQIEIKLLFFNEESKWFLIL